MRSGYPAWLPATLLLAGIATTAQADRLKPLTEVLGDARVGNVKPGTPVEVPLITWGGDIATIVANGNGLRTSRDSAFADEKLDLKLVRQDDFATQLRNYMAGNTPYLRGTMGMLNMAAEVLARDARTKPVVIYQMTWSAGGDALVVGPGITRAADLRGKRIGLQRYGPHVDYMTKVLADAGLRTSDVELKWFKDLTGTRETAMAALQAGKVDAAFVIIPDALVLTSGGTVGSGAEDSVRGASILLSTKTANRIIADVYAVRSDYLRDNRAQVEAFVHGLMVGEEKLRAQAAARNAAWRKTMKAAAKILLDTEQATADAEGLYADAEFVGHAGNVEFFTSRSYPRRMSALVDEIQGALIPLRTISKRVDVSDARWDYDRLRQGLKATRSAPAQRFDESQVAAVVTRRQQQGTLGEGELFAFEIFFEPNQNAFSADLYRESFARVIDLATTYGGALITIEGHSDPMGYLRDKKQGKPEVLLGRVKQSARNLSLSRAIAVRDSVIGMAQQDGVGLDPSQFAVIGHGIARPKSGLCGADPCAPKTEREWRDNMRVEFRIIQVEAEESVFKPL